MRCYLFDIDGTLADCSHRLPHIQKEPKDWRAFFAGCEKDAPIRHVIDICHSLALKHPIVLVSGRSDECKAATATWLQRNGVPYHELYMRQAGDHRDDDVLKSELLDKILADGYQPVMAFDDRDRVVKMWRSRGVPCAQVAEGNF